MSAVKTSGVAVVVAKIAIGQDELRVNLHRDGRRVIDLRWFERFAGASDAKTPTKIGISFPVEDLAEVIEGLRKAELLSRADLVGSAA